MIYAQPGQARTAVLTGAPAGIAANLRVRIVDPPNTVTIPEAAGAVEGPAGVYSFDFTAPAVRGDYLVVWRNAATGVETVEELNVGWSTPASIGIPAGGAYASPDALRGRLEVTPAELSDVAAQRILGNAERRIDRIAGAWPIRPNGRKLDPTTLPNIFADAIREATLDVAAAEYRDPDAFTPPAAKRVRGPDFELVDTAGVPPSGQVALRDAAARLDALNLRAVTARPRA